MKISIITCTWNSAAYLGQCIESVHAQSHPDVEHIFVDGGSTDGTLATISAVPGDIKIVRGVRGGISRAMNVGIAASSGDLVAQLHSDDFYLAPDVLSLVNSAMSASNAGWCFGRIKKVINGQLVSESYVAPHFSPVQLLKGNFIPHPATFVRRDWLLAAGGFDETLKYAMDYDLWLRLAKVGKPLELGQPLAAFRVHSGSLSSSNRLAAMAEDFSIRLTYTGPAPIARLEHYLRYWVRRRRAVTQLRATIADGMAT